MVTCDPCLPAHVCRLGMSYVDLYLMHSPLGGRVVETWDAMIELQKGGLVRWERVACMCRWMDAGNPYPCTFLWLCACRSIGVSNFNVHHLEELKKVRPHNIPASECVVHQHSVTVKQCALIDSIYISG